MAILKLIFGRRETPPDKSPPATTGTVATPAAPPPAETPPSASTRVRADKPTAPPAAVSRPNPRSGRVKTRLMKSGHFDDALEAHDRGHAASGRPISRPVGWLVIVEGPGTGAWFTLESGLSRIGRGDGQNVSLDFGDLTISRDSHASIAYEPADHRFRLGPGKSRNDVLVNGTPIRTTIDLKHGDLITVGETTLRLAAFCDDRFAWAPIIDRGNANVLSA